MDIGKLKEFGDDLVKEYIKEAEEIAKSLLEHCIDINIISESIGLSIEEINNL